jgi:hypothetical protein
MDFPTVINMIQKLKKVTPVLIVLLMIGCSKLDRTLTIYSDSVETAELVNLFNQTQSLYKASYIYRPEGSNLSINPGEHDIVISHSLQGYLDKMLSLDDLRETDFVNSIYPEILKMGISGTSLKTIPLSLDIPVVLTKDLQNDKKFISWEELGIQSKSFNVLKEERLTQSGFSPLWSETFLSAFYRSRIPSISKELDGNEFRGFAETAQELSEWIQDINGSLELDNDFSEKYRYIPDYRLILTGRTGYSVMPLSQWSLLPDSVSRELKIQPLIINEGLQNIETLAVGIPQTSENPEGAKAFLTWLLEEKTWEDYLLLTGRNRDEGFAFLGGISSSESLNAGLLLEAYPWTEPLIPRKGEFAKQSVLPPQWRLLWNDLLLPLVKESIAHPSIEKDMSNEYRKWLLLHPDPWDS